MASTTVEEARKRLVDRVRDLAYIHSKAEPFTLASGSRDTMSRTAFSPSRTDAGSFVAPALKTTFMT